MDPAEILRGWGFEVRQFSVYHFRVNGEFDFWLPRGKWHDLTTHERGKKPLEQIPFFVKERLAKKCEVSKEDFIKHLVIIGWTKEQAEEAWKERQ